MVMIGAGVSFLNLADRLCSLFLCERMLIARVDRTSCSGQTKGHGSELNYTQDPLSSRLPSHSFRLEHKLGPRLKVVALIDPSTVRADKVIEGKRQSFVESAYRDTKVFKTIDDYHQALNQNKWEEPQ